MMTVAWQCRLLPIAVGVELGRASTAHHHLPSPWRPTGGNTFVNLVAAEVGRDTWQTQVAVIRCAAVYIVVITNRIRCVLMKEGQFASHDHHMGIYKF